MNEAETVSTVDVLLDLGFEPLADPLPGLRFDFGNFDLRARELINLKFQEVVTFSGVLATPRTAAKVDFELPPRIASREQCAAMIVYYLDHAASGKTFEPTRRVDWLAEGRQNKHLLPWVIQGAKRKLGAAAYGARPHCFVRREWARLAINTLAIYLDPLSPEAVSDETSVVFFFKDSVLTIRWESEVIALAGRGVDWPTKYVIRAGQLRQFPKRFNDSEVEISIWNVKLRIGDQVYAVVEDLP
ncbi:MAG: hypothetical protein NTY19_03185 [Planctomycetota bacterium]|nr:hypothetical protein [Planctomycetota bacterium]